jgi:hypothetical protein
VLRSPKTTLAHRQEAEAVVAVAEDFKIKSDAYASLF